MTHGWDAPAGYEAVIGADIDAGELTELIVASETAIDGSSHTTQSFVNMFLQAPDVTRDNSTIVMRYGAAGDIAGFGLHRDPEPHVESVTNGWVHPSHRGQGLGTTIVQWGLVQARSRIPSAPEDTRVTSRCHASDADTAAAELFVDLGYSPDRHEIEMERVFDGSVAVAPIPAGITIRTVSNEEDVEAVARVSSDAFRDHYGGRSPRGTRRLNDGPTSARWTNGTMTSYSSRSRTA